MAQIFIIYKQSSSLKELEPFLRKSRGHRGKKCLKVWCCQAILAFCLCALFCELFDHCLSVKPLFSWKKLSHKYRYYRWNKPIRSSHPFPCQCKIISYGKLSSAGQDRKQLNFVKKSPTQPTTTPSLQRFQHLFSFWNKKKNPTFETHERTKKMEKDQ